MSEVRADRGQARVRAKEDLLLHPVRLRIVMATIGREVTAQQLAGELPDVPQATLYRNINALAVGGILVVVRERRVRNTVEKTYALTKQNLLLTAEDLRTAEPEEFVRLVTQYLGLLLGYFTRYIRRGDADLTRDNVLFQSFPLYLSHEEGQELAQAIRAALLPYLKNTPSPERERTIIGLTAVPDAAEARSPADSRPGEQRSGE